MTNKKRFKPAGYRILVKLPKKEKVSEGGIVLPDETVDLEYRAGIKGEVVAVGEDVNGWCKVGDTIIYAKYSGMSIPGEENLIFLNDEDVVATVTEEE